MAIGDQIPLFPGVPGAPGAPATPPPSQPPVDPATAAMFEKITQVIREQGVLISKNEETQREVNRIFEQYLKLSEDVETTYKKLIELGKKRKKQNLEEFRDAEKTRKELKEIIKLNEDALKSEKASAKEIKVMSKNLKEARDLLKDIGNESKLTENQFTRMNGVIEDAAHNVNDLVKAMSKLGRIGASLKGATGILGAMGIGRGLSRNVERRMEQIQEVKEKIEESRQIRRVATKKHMEKKREKSLANMATEGMGIETDKGRESLATRLGFKGDKRKAFITGEKAKHMKALRDKSIAEIGDVSTDEGRAALAEKIGLTKGTQEHADFIAGEKAGGPDATGVVGEAWKKATGISDEAMAGGEEAMASGAGAIETAMTTFETGIEGLMGAMEELAAPILALAGPIMLLIAAWDSYAKTNQEIEKGVGAGGLFTQPGVGATQAFLDARNALVPNAGTNVPLGITFERNLALASAMTQSGYNVADSFGEGAQNIANKLPGSQGEFMQGSVGEFQRVVMGVSRVSGLTDAEGTENLIKLLQQYRETVGSSEDFMRMLNRDTQAAGISTTKYLKIIDEVSSHFDRMNKSLEQVTGVMRELSRYGDVSSESLKDMMDYLATGQAKTTMSNLSQSIYINMVTPKKIKEAAIKAEGDAVDTTVAAVNAQLNRPGAKDAGIAPLDITGMSIDEAQRVVSSKRQEATRIKDRNDRTAVIDALDRVSDQMLHQKTVQGDAMQQAAGTALYGPDLIQQTEKMFGTFNEVLGQAGADMTDLTTGNLTGEQMVQIQKEAQLLELQDPAKIRENLRTEATNRIQEATKEETPLEKRRLLIKQLLAEIARRPNGIKTTLARTQWEDFTGSIDDLGDDMASHSDKASLALGRGANIIGGSIETQTNFIEKMGKEEKSGVMSERRTLEKAGGIGLNTQTVEDILKNVIKPLLDDMVSALIWIAKAASKYLALGKDFDPTAAQEDIKKIPDAVKILEAKAADMEDEQSKLADKWMDDNGKWKDPKYEAQFNDLAEKHKKATDTIAYLNETQTTGAVRSDKELQYLDDTINTTLEFAKGGNKIPTAPTAEDLQTTWKDIMLGNPSIKPSSPVDTNSDSYKYFYNIYNGQTNQEFNTPDSAGKAHENAPTIKGTMPTKSAQPQ